MLLAERLRSLEEKEMVKSVLEEYLKVKLNPSEMYYGETSEALRVLRDALRNPELVKDTVVASIAPTRSLLRLITLVMTCIEQKEPVLLVGGKSSLR
jgi:midasin